MYGPKHDLIFNPLKTKLLIFRNKSYRDVTFPKIYLNGSEIEVVTRMKYLGIWLCDDLNDDIDILRQVRHVYAQGNSIIKKFHMYNTYTKVLLFKTYIYNLMGSHLWFRYKQISINKLRVAYNNVFRIFFKIPRLVDGENVSIRGIFVSKHVQSFYERVRWSQVGFIQRLLKCKNSGVKHFLWSSDVLHMSPIWAHWITSVMAN